MSLQGTRNTCIELFDRDVWRPTNNVLTDKSYMKYIHLCLRLTTIYRIYGYKCPYAVSVINSYVLPICVCAFKYRHSHGMNPHHSDV